MSYGDGKDVWDKDVKFKSIPAVTYDEAEKKVILFESGTGYKFDLATGAMTVFAEDIKLENVTRQTPLEAEYRPTGYVLYTDQHMSFLDKKGKLVYTRDYPQLSTTDFTDMAQFGAIVAGIPIDIAGSIENMKQLDRLSKGAYRNTNAASQGTSKTQVVAAVYLNNSKLFDVTQTRYSNSRNARDHKFIMTKEDETKRGILMVNKDTGKADKKINIVDVTPLYVVDEIDSRVFIVEKNKTITGYDMK